LGGLFLNERAITLVKESFNLVEPTAPQTAALSYANLFEADPSLKLLFKDDMVAQGQKLMLMLMPAPPGLRPRHIGHGVLESHCDSLPA
jgi:hypothetical protein